MRSLMFRFSVFFVLVTCTFFLQAQTITHMLDDKSMQDFIKKAEGLRMNNSGQVLLTSSEDGVLLRQQGDSFEKIALTPTILKDDDVSGIDQMSDGRLVIADRDSNSVVITDSNASSRLLQFSKSGDDAGEIDDPVDLVVSVNKRIYIADRDNHRISVFNDQGLFLQHFGHHDRRKTDLSRPTHIALDAHENIYVLESGDANRVGIYAADGRLIKQLNTKAIAKQLGSSIDFSAMTADLNGLIYLADDNSKQIFSYDWQQDKILNRFGSLGQSRGQYRNIARLSVNNQGQLAVLDKVNKKVEIYQLEQKKYNTPLHSGLLQLGQKIASNCRSVHAFINNQTLCIKPDAKSITILSAQGKEVGQFAKGLKSITTLHSGPQMVAVLSKNVLHTYTHAGKKIYSVGRYGIAEGAFDKPIHVFTAHNKVYVADKGNNRVQIFAQDGQFIAQIKGGLDETFKTVGPLAVDSQQNLYVAEAGSHPMIRVFDASLKLIASIGYTEDSSHKATKIYALDIDQQDRLYALLSSDINDFSVRVYQDHQQVLEFGSGAENGTPAFFDNAESMSVASTDRNSIYINDTGLKQLFRFDYLEPPDAAFGLQVSANKSQVTLQWDSTQSPLIASYEIQAAATEDGPFEKIASSTDVSKTLSHKETRNLPWFRIVSVSGFELKAKPSKARENKFFKLDKLYQAKQYDKAIALAEQLLKTAPDNADTLLIKADSELSSGQQQAAISSFVQLQKYPQYKNIAIRKQVQAYFELEQYLDAKALIDQVLATQPKEADPYLICTQLSIQINDAIGAVTCAEDGLALHPQHARLRYLLGKAYLIAGIPDSALPEFQTVIKNHPKDNTTRLLIADELMQLKQYKEALTHYSYVSKAEPGSGKAAVGKANALLKLNRDDEAKAIAVKLSAQKKTQGEGYYVLGKISVKQQKYTEAILRLTRASKITPKNIDAWLTLAGAYVELNQLPRAVSALKKGASANPESFQLFEMAGRLELEQEHFPEANEYLDVAVRLNKQSLAANKLYARSLFSSRNYRTAATYAERAARIAPRDIEVLTLQADIADRQGKVGSAIEFLKTAISIEPASPQLQYQLGRVYQNANLFDASREHLEKAAGINPSWADPHVAMGQLFTKRRLFDEAIQSFEKAVSLDPSDNNRAMLNSAFAEKKKSMEFKSNAPQLQLSDLNLQHVFSAAYKQYANKPIGSVTLKNVSTTEYGNLQLSFQIREYMDFPVTQEIPLIKGKQTQQYDFRVTFNNKILEVDEDTGVQVEVKLIFSRDGQKDSIRLTQPMTIYGKNAMVWGNPQMVGSFVTPKDDTLRNFVRTVINEYQPKAGPLNDKLVAAMTYFSSINAIGTRYIVDPNTPYSSLREDQVDYVQFPRETLKLKSGDCDDLSVLLSAGLENLGIETVLLEVPGHLLMMFNTGLDAEDAGLISRDRSLLAINQDKVWIPVEATMVGASFNEAWAEGARKYQKALSENKLGIIELKKAWQQYPPVTLSKANYSIDLPPQARTASLVKTAQNQLLNKSIDRVILPYQSMIVNNPKDIRARLQIAILYTRYGLFDDAQLAFDALLELAPDDSAVHSNLGNLYLLSEKYDKAIESYQKAVKLDDKDGGILLNLSMANYRKGDVKTAATLFANAVAIKPELKTSYSAYGKLLNQ